jgi:hypothetical protein
MMTDDLGVDHALVEVDVMMIDALREVVLDKEGIEQGPTREKEDGSIHPKKGGPDPILLIEEEIIGKGLDLIGKRGEGLQKEKEVRRTKSQIDKKIIDQETRLHLEEVPVIKNLVLTDVKTLKTRILDRN